MYFTVFVIAIVVIFLFVLSILIIRSKTRSNIIYGSGYTYQNVKDMLKTGDIILFESMENGSSYGNFKHFMISSVLGIKFKHSGIVLRYGNELYLLECCRYKQAGYKYATYINKNNNLVECENHNKGENKNCEKPGGVRIIKLDDIIREYTNEYRGKFCVKFINQAIPNGLILKEFEKYTDVKFGSMQKVLFRGILNILLSINPNDTEFHDSMICSEFTHKMLLDCDVIKNNISSNVFWPFYYYNGIFDRLAIIKYSNPICFSYC